MFKSGTTYHYSDVPKEVHDDLMKAESKGKFLNTDVKGKFEFTKVEK